MQAPYERPAGYSTTAPQEADTELRELRRAPCRGLRVLGVRYLAVHGPSKACGGRLLARDGPISLYRVESSR